MNSDKRGNLTGGIILVLLGLFFLMNQLFPQILGGFTWPFIIMIVGAVFLVIAVVTRTGPLAVPGCIIGGVGGILYLQNLTSNWASWSYMWTLIPGFVGIGLLLSGLISPETRNWRSAITLLVISAIGFLIFGGAFEFNLDIGKFWPVILIVMGISALIGAFTRSSEK